MLFHYRIISRVTVAPPFRFRLHRGYHYQNHYFSEATSTGSSSSTTWHLAGDDDAVDNFLPQLSCSSLASSSSRRHRHAITSQVITASSRRPNCGRQHIRSISVDSCRSEMQIIRKACGADRQHDMQIHTLWCVIWYVATWCALKAGLTPA